jgi:RNA polymerase sigma-70 factor (ECF subfamily)
MNKQNQQQFFEDVIEQHKGILFKVAKTYCRNDDDRQDLVQEMMIQIWRSLHRYNNQFAITTWLYRVSLNVAISFYRKNSTKQNLRVPLIDEVLLIQDPKPFEREEQLELLDQFISELNDLDRALMLLYLEDKSHAEISEIIGISVTNVGTKLGRIKEKLKKKFSLINK